MAVPRTDKQIKRAIADTIIAIVGSDGTSHTPKVYPWNVLKPLGLDDRDRRTALAEWAGIFTYTPIVLPSPTEVYGEPKIHGWMIKRSERLHELSNSDCATFFPAYDVWFFYEFYQGNEENNSENEANLIIDSVCDGFIGGLLDVAGLSLKHEGLQFPTISLLRSGDKAMHVGLGRIEFEFGD